jgi:hypothetical protein
MSTGDPIPGIAPLTGPPPGVFPGPDSPLGWRPGRRGRLVVCGSCGVGPVDDQTHRQWHQWLLSALNTLATPGTYIPGPPMGATPRCPIDDALDCPHHDVVVIYP